MPVPEVRPPGAAWRHGVIRAGTWLLVAACGLWVAVRLLGAEPPWPASALLAFTPWVIVPAVVGLGVAATVRDRWAVAAAAATVLALAVAVAPRSWGTAGTPDGVVLRVMTANLRVGGADAATIVELVRDGRIDVLALQEYTGRARDDLDRAGLAALLPYRVADPEPLGIGSAIYARVPLTGGATPVDPGGFVEATATVHPPGAAAVVVRSVHPCAPLSRAHERCWEQGLDGEPRATPRGVPRLLMGDFNATLDHPALRRLLGSGYRDAAAATGTGLKPTWPADLVPIATLDHVLVDTRIGVRTVSVHPVPDTDHRAVCAVLTLPPPGGVGRHS